MPDPLGALRGRATRRPRRRVGPAGRAGQRRPGRGRLQPGRPPVRRGLGPDLPAERPVGRAAHRAGQPGRHRPGPWRWPSRPASAEPGRRRGPRSTSSTSCARSSLAESTCGLGRTSRHEPVPPGQPLDPTDRWPGGAPVDQSAPLPLDAALRRLSRCAVDVVGLLARRRIHQPSEHVGLRLRLRGRHVGPGLPGDRRRRRAARGPLRARGRVPAARPCAAGGTPSSAGRACSTPRCSSASPASSPSCGWPTTSAARYRGVYEWDGPERAEALRPLPSGGCSRWAACRARSATWCCPGCGATTCCAEPAPGEAAAPGDAAAWWRPVRGRMSPAADLLVVGAGPTGLALALQAHDHGARVRIVERRPEAFRPSRALIVHPRTLEVLRPLGVTDGAAGPGGHRAGGRPAPRPPRGPRSAWPGSRCRTRAFPHLTLVRQMDVEAVLAQALADRGVAVERGTEVIDVRQAGRRRAAPPSGRRPGVETVPSCASSPGATAPAAPCGAAPGIGWRGGPYGEEVVLADVELDGDLDAGASPTSSPADAGCCSSSRSASRRPGGCWRPGPRGLRRRCRSASPAPPSRPRELQALWTTRASTRGSAQVAWSARYRLQHRLAAGSGRAGSSWRATPPTPIRRPPARG